MRAQIDAPPIDGRAARRRAPILSGTLGWVVLFVGGDRGLFFGGEVRRLSMGFDARMPRRTRSVRQQFTLVLYLPAFSARFLACRWRSSSHSRSRRSRIGRMSSMVAQPLATCASM